MSASRVTALGLAVGTVMVADPAKATAGYRDEDYLAFADRVVLHLDRLWDPAEGHYRSGVPSFDAQFNAALLVVHAVAADRGWRGPARKDGRARRIAHRLVQSPPFWTRSRPRGADGMFHRPGWLGDLSGRRFVMHAMIDPKVGEGLQAVYRARRALGLAAGAANAIASRIRAVADGPFFRYPRVRLNQINWPLELHLHEHLISGRRPVLAHQYRLHARRFLSRRGRLANLGPTLRFIRHPELPSSWPSNLDSPEYANIVLSFIQGYDEARRAGMPPLPGSEKRLLRAWVRRALYGYWTHAGFLSWDTGMGRRRWMKGKYWAYAQQGLLAVATAARFRTRAEGRWAKTIFDRGLRLFDRLDPPGTGPWTTTPSGLFGVSAGRQYPGDDRMFAARMAANAARAVWAGLGSAKAAEPPPFYAFDADIGRLSISTPVYATAVVSSNRGVLPYGGIELARLFDADGDPLTNVGGRGRASMGVVVRDPSGRPVFGSQSGRRRFSPALRLVRSPHGRLGVRRRLRPAVGPFDVVTAVGRLRDRRIEVVTRHRFTRGAIDLQWRVKRRRGERRHAVAVRFPSWGRGAGVDAELDDGRVVALAAGGHPVAAVPLRRVRTLRVHAAGGSYALTPTGQLTGTARTVRVAPQAAAPKPGPTLELRLRRRLGNRPIAVGLRLDPG